MHKKKAHPYIGKTITAVRPMTKEEAEREGWSFGRHSAPSVVVLSDGSLIYASRDPEGNGPGELFGVLGGTTIRVRAE